MDEQDYLDSDDQQAVEDTVEQVASGEANQGAPDVPVLEANDKSDDLDTNDTPSWLYDRKSPIKILRTCLDKSFDATRIRIFCQDYYYAVYKRIDGSHGFDNVIAALIDYCEQNNETEALWGHLKKESGWYAEYYPRWKKAVELEKKQRDSQVFTGIGRQQYAFREEKSNSIDGEVNENPLEQDEPLLAQWFFTQLTNHEQSVLLTAALFEGMARPKLLQLTRDIESILDSYSQEEVRG